MATDAHSLGAPSRALSFQAAYARAVTMRRAFNAWSGIVERVDEQAHAAFELEFHDAIDTLEATPATNWSEFVDALEFCAGELCTISPDHMAKLIADARRLDGRA